jgi:3-hydroxyisobutyrate dehydrogenase-like beta-hydroxyacid dehydrogenase
MAAETIGFCGMGMMGRPMAANLVAAGFTVRGWNRTRGKAPQGVVECESPRDTATGARIVITMLADDAAVQAVMLGEHGLLGALREGGIHLGMSTISTALSQRLYEAHKAAKQSFVAAPVFGRPDAAAARKLRIVAGGDEQAITQSKPIFDALAEGVFPVGTAVQASLAKLCGNFMIAALIESFGEAFAVAEKSGMDPVRLAETLSKILFASAPLPTGYASRIAATQFEPAGFAMPLGFKDISLALRAAEDLKVPLPLASLIKNNIVAALANGRDKWDWGGLVSAVREAAGLPARRT